MGWGKLYFISSNVRYVVGHQDAICNPKRSTIKTAEKLRRKSVKKWGDGQHNIMSSGGKDVSG
ncbi:hypothetical protein BYT27DRAFT_7180279 [Phlegmacium glaucopus]|nr:hypothetical protein BYT27DRAFT_7180279 [Phlegmacium glaucopus]